MPVSYTHLDVYKRQGVVGALGTGVGDGVEQSGLSHVGQPHDT